MKATPYGKSFVLRVLSWFQTTPHLDDGRPFDTDTYLVMALDAVDDMYDFRDGCKAWTEGDWTAALEMLSPPRLTGDHWALVADHLLKQGSYSEAELRVMRLS